MKRSEINKIISDAASFAKEMNFRLPPFAFWSPEEWKTKGEEFDEIRDNMLGWDITDWGSGDFYNRGLVLFTMRNGNLKNKKYNKAYAQKMLIVEDGQFEPYHFHWNKVEDIINMGGGDLYIQVVNATADGKVLDEPVKITIDGKALTVKAGESVKISPGESITLQTLQYHAIYAKGGKVLAMEVSVVNDDLTDNYFMEDGGRFPEIIEDEEPIHLLVTDYKK
jgi:D-lyxose ketol-isomerase